MNTTIDDIDIKQLEADAFQAWDKAITNITMNHSFFSVIALNLHSRADWSISTACTDGTRLLYNPSFLLSLSPEERIGLVIHELFHVILLHPFRMRKDYHDHKLANIAMDFEINNHIDTYIQEWSAARGGRAASIALPKGGLLDHQYDGLTWEEIYEKILQQAEQGGGDPDPDGSGGFGEVTMPGGCATEEEKREAAGSGKAPYETFTAADWSEKIAQAETVAKMRGSMPGSLSTLCARLRAPEIAWPEYLRRYFDAHAQDDYDARRSDRRHLPRDFYLPTLFSECMGDVVIAIDTSGSIYYDQSLFERFMGETADIMSRLKPRTTTVIQCDTRVTDVREYQPGDVLALDIKGGGGTDFRPVFDHINERGIEPKVLVFYTDGYGEYPPTPPAGYDVLWVDYGNYDRYPFGEVIRTNPNASKP